MSLSPTDTRTPERPRHETVDFFQGPPRRALLLETGPPAGIERGVYECL